MQHFIPTEAYNIIFYLGMFVLLYLLGRGIIATIFDAKTVLLKFIKWRGQKPAVITMHVDAAPIDSPDPTEDGVSESEMPYESVSHVEYDLRRGSCRLSRRRHSFPLVLTTRSDYPSDSTNRVWLTNSPGWSARLQSR